MANLVDQLHPKVVEFWGPNIIGYLVADKVIRFSTHTEDLKLLERIATMTITSTEVLEIIYHFNGVNYNEERMLKIIDFIAFS